MLWREMQSRKQEEENRRGIKGLFVFLNYLLREDFFCDFLLLLYFGRLLVQRQRKEATQIFGLRGSCFDAESFYGMKYAMERDAEQEARRGE